MLSLETVDEIESAIQVVSHAKVLYAELQELVFATPGITRFLPEFELVYATDYCIEKLLQEAQRKLLDIVNAGHNCLEREESK